jgi:small subunit ribosomal protein S17
MADEEQNENVEETTAAPEAEVPEAVEAPEAAGDEATAEAPAGDGDDAAKAPAAAPAGTSKRVERRQARAEKVAREAGSRPSRTPEERQAERDAARKARASARRTQRAKLREKAKGARAAAPGEPTPPREHGEGRQKVRQGVVVSDKADKTITVRIDTARQHRRYHKIVRSSSTLHAHDESNDANIGDTVVVRECRPLSRLKRWRLVEVVERAR